LITERISPLPRSTSGYAASIVCVHDENPQRVKKQGMSSKLPTVMPLVQSPSNLGHENPSEATHQEIGGMLKKPTPSSNSWSII
jgi:hypothetical protein